MSRYSSNLPSASPGVRLPLGFSPKTRTPDSTSPSRFHPPICVLVWVWADATPVLARTATTATSSRAVLICPIGGPLASQPETGRVVRAVNGHVPLGPRPAHDELLSARVPAIRPRRMPRLGVTLLAEPRLRKLEHCLVIRTVRGVTG